MTNKARARKLDSPPPFQTVADNRIERRTSEKQNLMALREQIKAGSNSAKAKAALAQIQKDHGDAEFKKAVRIFNSTYKGQQDVKLPPGVGPNVGRNK